VKKVSLNAANYAESSLNEGYNNVLSEHVNSIMDIIEKVWGEDYIQSVLEKEDLLDKMESDDIGEKLYVLQRLVLKEDTYSDDPLYTIEQVEKELSRIIAKRHVENKIEVEVEKILEERQEKMIDDIRLGIIKKQRGPENSKTLKRLEDLETKDKVKLSKNVMELLRPSSLDELQQGLPFLKLKSSCLLLLKVKHPL